MIGKVSVAPYQYGECQDLMNVTYLGLDEEKLGFTRATDPVVFIGAIDTNDRRVRVGSDVSVKKKPDGHGTNCPVPMEIYSNPWKSMF